MSDNWLVVVEQSIRDAEVAAQRAKELTDWLLATGIVVRREPRESSDGEYAPGPEVLAACPDFSGPPGQLVRGRTWTSDVRPSEMRWNGIAVLSEWRVHAASGQGSEPMCPRCFADYGGEAYFEAARIFEQTKVEPLLRCRACGTDHPLGDWPGSGLLIGHLAVEFHNWSDFAPAFENQLRRRMGGRTQVVECHL